MRVNFAREILDHAEREHQANVLRYDSVMVALQEANRSAGAPDGTRDSVPSDQHRQEPAREEAESPDEVAPGGPNSADLRRVVSEADEMQRSSAVLRSRLEADELRKQVRAARQRREAQEAEERRRKEQETVAKVRPPPAPFVQRNRSEPLPEEDFCSPEYQPPPPMQRNASWSSTDRGASPSPTPAPETSVQMNASQPSSPTEAAPHRRRRRQGGAQEQPQGVPAQGTRPARGPEHHAATPRTRAWGAVRPGLLLGALRRHRRRGIRPVRLPGRPV